MTHPMQSGVTKYTVCLYTRPMINQPLESVATPSSPQPSSAQRLPDWFRRSLGKRNATLRLSDRLGDAVPNSICEEARCPNRAECFSKGVLTFMILGTTCTRNCGFCSVRHGKPLPPDPEEITPILHAIRTLNLRFVVLTSPNRDDLPDGGASHFALTVQTIQSHFPDVKVEVLIPDFKGVESDLVTVINSRPHVLNHNIETVPSLYRTVRKGSLYQRSMTLLARTKQLAPSLLVKTGLMVGLGETGDELARVFDEVARSGVDILTIGQYLKPDKQSLDIVRYYHPDEFEALQSRALSAGIRYVFSGPHVRSSFLAEHVFDDLHITQ